MNSPATDTLPLLSSKRTSDAANNIIPSGITDWPTLGLLLRGAMTDNGDNDTSVAFGAARGVPGGGETPMRKNRSLSSVASPYAGVLRINTT